jgi:hypothetical protein
MLTICTWINKIVLQTLLFILMLGCGGVIGTFILGGYMMVAGIRYDYDIGEWTGRQTAHHQEQEQPYEWKEEFDEGAYK